MAMLIKPRYAQHEQIVTLRLEPKNMSWSSMDMRIYNHHTGEQLFQTDGRVGSFSRRVRIGTCSDGKNLEQPLYTLKQKRLVWEKTFFAIDDENGSTSETPIFRSTSIGGTFGKDKNDMEIEFCEKPGMPMQKLYMIKTDEKGISQIVNEHQQVVARIMRDKSGFLQTRSSPRDVIIADVMPGVDISLILLSIMSLHVMLVVRRRQRSGAAAGGGGVGAGAGAGVAC